VLFQSKVQLYEEYLNLDAWCVRVQSPLILDPFDHRPVSFHPQIDAASPV
jgi:hypothetical protein